MDVVPFSKVQGALEATLIPRLAADLGQQLADGKTVRVEDREFRAWLHLAGGLVLLLFGLLLVLSIRLLHFGIPVFRSGLLAVRRGWRCKGADFEVAGDGLYLAGAMLPSDHHRWSAIRELHVDAAGMIVHLKTAACWPPRPWPRTIGRLPPGSSGAGSSAQSRREEG